MERVRLTTDQPRPLRAAERASSGGNYFNAPAVGVNFFSSGCALLDLALGGGWAEGRVSNIVGDRAVGKTLLAIEAIANFAAKHPTGRIFFRESEAAFDRSYALALGIPLDRVEMLDESEVYDTVEDFFRDMCAVCGVDAADLDKLLPGADVGPAARPKFYILDSLDALSDAAEMKRAIDKASFGATKAAQLSELFRKLIRPMQRARVTLMVVNQVRENIGVTFGEKFTRSGGKALDFYASQRLDLANLGKITRETTMGGGAKVKRVTGVRVRGHVKKNKVGLAHREAEFPMIFGYGVDEARACVDFLKGSGGLGANNSLLGRMKEDAFLRMCARGTGDHARALDNLRAAVRRRWYDIENKFLPTRQKYGAQSGGRDDGDQGSAEATGDAAVGDTSAGADEAG